MSNPPEPDLETSLRQAWDARIVGYDRARFPFAERLLKHVQSRGYDLDSLDRLHEVVPADQVYRLSKALCEATLEPDFRALVEEFVRAEIAPQGQLVAPLAVQRFLNVRIMLPGRPQGVFPFHTGLLYGHGSASRSLWLPLTDVTDPADSSASMQIIHLERSRELTREAIERRLSIPEMNALFGAESHPLHAGPGQVVLFSQEHIHGNFVNETGKTRVSIDFRIAESRFGDKLARKQPGGYFELLDGPPSEPTRNFSNGRTNLIYLNNNTSHSEAVPVHLQRYMVHEYCGVQDLKYEFELFELERMDHLPTLMHIVEELQCNAILYSIYSLPEDRAFRDEIFDAAEQAGVILHFVNERLAVTSPADRARVEEVLAFAKYGQTRSEA